jgi:hypothetical protein
MLSQLDFKIFGLETIKNQYVHDDDFKDVLLNCKEGKTWNKFVLTDGFMFRANKLCIPTSSVHMLLLQEAHGGGVDGTLESPSLILVINDTKLLMPCVKCFELGISNTCDEGVCGKEWWPQDHKEMVHEHKMMIMVEMHIK